MNPNTETPLTDKLDSSLSSFDWDEGYGKLLESHRTFEKELAATKQEVEKLKLQLEIFTSWDGADDVVALCNSYHDSEQERTQLAVENERLKKDLSKSTDTLDMMNDEFKRILALTLHENESEIRGLCERAISGIEQTIPVIVQGDRLEKELTKLRQDNLALVAEIERLKNEISNR